MNATAEKTVFLCVSYSERDKGSLFDLAAYEDDVNAYRAAFRREVEKGEAADGVTGAAILGEIRDMKADAELIRWAQRHGRCGYSVNAHGCVMYGCKH
ncbi:hypothetical protein [Streptomyces sp. NPDC092370]|uniref:hypothetical protein n=1 Tax=Streptomyces sp. NPDC092370 TaxID=3366016 RepID=UPI003830BF29